MNYVYNEVDIYLYNEILLIAVDFAKESHFNPHN